MKTGRDHFLTINQHFTTSLTSIIKWIPKWLSYQWQSILTKGWRQMQLRRVFKKGSSLCKVGIHKKVIIMQNSFFKIWIIIIPANVNFNCFLSLNFCFPIILKLHTTVNQVVNMLYPLAVQIFLGTVNKIAHAWPTSTVIGVLPMNNAWRTDTITSIWYGDTATQINIKWNLSYKTPMII